MEDVLAVYERPHDPARPVVCLDVPAAALRFLNDVQAELWITEGAKKVDAAVCHGIGCSIGLSGVWMWRDGAKVNLPDWDDITVKSRVAVIAFDSDVMTKPSVRGALQGLAGFLRLPWRHGPLLPDSPA